jgi:hypothetical protein
MSELMNRNVAVAVGRTEEGMEVNKIFIFYRKTPDTSASANRDHSPSPPQQPSSRGSYSQVSRAETSLFSWTPPLLSSVPHGKPSYYFTSFCINKKYVCVIFRLRYIISVV